MSVNDTRFFCAPRFRVPATWRLSIALVMLTRSVNAVIAIAMKHLRFLLRVLIVCSVVAATPSLAAAAPPDSALVVAFHRGGASELAVRVLDSQQRKSASREEWHQWERLRIGILSGRGKWADIVVRAGQLTADDPAPFRRWLLTQTAEAEINLGRADAARSILRRLIWDEGGGANDLAHWRRLVIRSYLVDDRVADARAALLRYNVDYKTRSASWDMLRARVLIRDGDYGRAVQVLADVHSSEARLLRLHAGLEGGVYKPAQVIRDAALVAKRKNAGATDRRQANVLVARAASRAGDAEGVVRATEAALNESAGTNGEFFTVIGDELWRAYDRLAEMRGNEARLLVGNDAAWLEHAAKADHARSVTGRAIYAFLAHHGATEIAREISHQRLATSLFRNDTGAVALALYAAADGDGLREAVPDDVRYALAGEALKQRRIRLAADLMRDLKLVPAGENEDDWRLRRARTLIFAGDIQPAAALLRQVIGRNRKLEAQRSRRLLQLLFDLQAIEEHTVAYELMEQVYDRLTDAGLRRELLYWMADSRFALARYQDAAALYLRSAIHIDPRGNDLWGQSARYQAAESLVKAGLVDDARALYRALIRVTEDPKRRLVIEGRLQQLWLTENRATTQ